MRYSWMKNKAVLKTVEIDSYGKNIPIDKKDTYCKFIDEEKEIRISGSKELIHTTATIIIPSENNVDMETIIEYNGKDYSIAKFNSEEGKDISGKEQYKVIYLK